MKVLYDVILAILVGMICIFTFVALFVGDTAAAKKDAPPEDYGQIQFAGAVFIVLFVIAVVLGSFV